MAKSYTHIELNNLKRVSTFAAMYKGKKKTGVSSTYIRQLIEEEKIEIITIDDVQFIDISSLPDTIRKNLKKH